MTELPDIKYLFEPRSVAVVGASHDESKVGYKVLENIVKGGYTGDIYPVNPKGGEILGLPVLKRIEDIPEGVDIAFIIIPGKYVFEAVKSCAERKAKFLPIISSGFSEVGNIKEEQRIVEYAAEHGMRVLGPNIFGIYTAEVSLNGTFGPSRILKGNVAIISQSGALGGSMIGKTAVENIGLSTMVSVGNKADIGEPDLLRYLMKSDTTKVIFMYIEGVKEGEELISVLSEATRLKPVIVIKSGRSKRGAMAAASHTGSLAGQDEVFDAIMKQCGVLRAESLQEAFNWCKFLASAPLPRGNATVIITNGGGLGVMATDACEKYDVSLYDDTEILKEAFSEATPDFGSTKNPVDITGQATPQHYESALKAALDNESINSVIALYCETAVFDLDAFITLMKQYYKKSLQMGKPLLFSLLGGQKIEECIHSLKNEGVPVYSDVYECVSCLGSLYRFYHHQLGEKKPPEEYDIDYGAIEAVVEKARAENRYFLLAHEARSIMEAASIPTPQSYIAKTLDQAVTFAEKVGYPVVMKVVSRDIIHKSDAGGVALDLENKEELMDAYQAILYNSRQYNPHARIDGIEVAEMVEKGTETIVGARVDQSFGPVVMFGLGGIYVEVMKDVSFRAFPLDREEVLTMMKETRSYPLLLGVRGEEKKDIESVIDAIMKVGAVIHNCAHITDIEVNPLVVYEQGVKAVDVRILLKREKGGDMNE
ncbi:MAG: acetate--CoA ligase family protein [Theionarchaea archaeon]|nr:acetate--CoA ligase family protein [Theionarchaea archaeon]MBU7022297.1 acetate--CoA ligase family protein [Theionarchaea archaeon]MBU7035052.1 acetate--CoA ligase family protein [Theionarchaea archaeon]MBU7040672.1 acetate--CoA ligase family protein [Theionarchaea archaeon]